MWQLEELWKVAHVKHVQPIRTEKFSSGLIEVKGKEISPDALARNLKINGETFSFERFVLEIDWIFSGLIKGQVPSSRKLVLALEPSWFF
ncbi:hypothetical protein TNCV_3067861 [Trichonephila clavipes]|nr:hypothetical protein TNCV_3067861 [Trichonephila clavipes]